MNPVRPRAASLVELLLSGALEEEEVMMGGWVSDDVRDRAEFAWLTSRGRLRPHTAPSTRSAPPLRHAQPRHSAPTAQPRRSAPTAQTRRTSSTASHVARVRLRRSLTDDEAARHPQSLALDVCCVCYARERDHVFQPCFHMCVCGTCAERLMHCPLCRIEVHSTHRVYF